MRTAALCTALLVCLLLGLAETPPANKPDLAFLAGHWRAAHAGTVMDEHWFPPEHASTTGMLRWFDGDGRVRMLELLSFAPGEDGELVFRMRHFDGEMKPWESERDGPLTGVAEQPEPGRLVIRCTAHAGDVETITYHAVEADHLRVTIRFRDDAGRDPIVIDFRRVE